MRAWTSRGWISIRRRWAHEDPQGVERWRIMSHRTCVDLPDLARDLASNTEVGSGSVLGDPFDLCPLERVKKLQLHAQMYPVDPTFGCKKNSICAALLAQATRIPLLQACCTRHYCHEPPREAMRALGGRPLGPSVALCGGDFCSRCCSFVCLMALCLLLFLRRLSRFSSDGKPRRH